MSYAHQTPDATQRRSGAFRRWFVRLLFVTCIAVMGAVILSEPRMAEKTAAAVDLLKERLAQDKAEDEAVAPVVSAMPSNRVQVNRPTTP